MIIITKKLHPRRLAAGCLLGACAVILLGAAVGVVEAVPAAPVSSVAAADGSDIRTNADRVAYLESLGWLTAAQPSAEEALTLPTKFDEAYQAYLTLQRSQGFDLTRFAGKQVKRYVYSVTNYQNATAPVYATLLSSRGDVSGGDITSTAGAGLMHGFSKPESTKSGSGGAAAEPSAPPEEGAASLTEDKAAAIEGASA